MSEFQTVFQRIEKKFLLTPAQYNALLPRLEQFMQADEYGKSQIGSLYYDTPDDLLIRRSIEKPVFKEKLRVRCYGTAKENSTVFVELKRKYNGVVYKRRANMPCSDAERYLSGKADPPKPGQITREIDWFLHCYPGIRPAMFISYQRQAYFGKENKALRVTFDSDIRWRTDELNLTTGARGTALLPPDKILMEVKIPGSMPVWMAELFDSLRIYTDTFSKYGSAYKALHAPEKTAAEKKGGIRCA